jgi:hypothetical protein
MNDILLDTVVKGYRRPGSRKPGHEITRLTEAPRRPAQ